MWLLFLTCVSGLPYTESSYCSVSHLVLVVMLGLSLSYPERQFDSNIPFIWGNLTLAFKHLPMAYMAGSFTLSILFER